MNSFSHMMFGFGLFVALYSLVYAASVWLSDIGLLSALLFYYLAGGVLLTVVVVPILFYKAPNKEMADRTTSNRASAGALTFIVFCLGTLVGSVAYHLVSGVPIIGNLSIFIGAFIMMSGTLMPDWDIPLMGIERHRNVIFHSAVLPMLIVLMTLINVFLAITSTTSLRIGAATEYYITALFLLGYAAHLYLDVFPSDASPLEILWISADPAHKAPTGLKPFGPIKVGKGQARTWLVGNATLLLMIATALFALYFYNILMPPSP